MAKPSSKTRQGPAARVAREVRSFSSRLTDQSVLDASSGFIIILALSLLLLRGYQQPHVDQLAAGSIASEDIIAAEDLKIPDPAETKRLREQASAAVLPVFDFNSRAGRDAVATISELFDAAREDLGSSPDQMMKRIEDRTAVTLEPEQLAVLTKHHFSSELEDLMIEHLESAMMSPIVGSRSQLRKLGANAINRRDRSGQEVMVTDLSTIHDKLTASASLKSERMIWPASYNARERRFLGDILGSLVVPNIEYNETETESRRSSAREAQAEVMVGVERGRPMVSKGETVTPIKAALLAAAAKRRPIGQRLVEFAGTFVIVTVLVLVLWQYLLRYQRRHLRVRRHFLLQIVCFFVTVGLARIFFVMGSAMSHWASSSPFNEHMPYFYLAPLAVGAVLVTILTDANAAFVFSSCLTVFIGVLTGNVFVAAYTLVSNAAAIYHLQHCRDRSSLVRAGVWMGLVNASAALALDLLGGSERPAPMVLSFDTFCAFGSGMLAAMVASILLPLFEWLFEITTSFKLLELSNLNLPLLRQLAERAPGTYHHSIVVGLLAEAGAESIDGDTLFARVACLYHDIGKTVRPSYFVENQSYMDNRHDRLSPRMSSIVLANHVKQGIEIAREHKLPPRIISIIPEHHGTGLMKYFYYKARKEAEDANATALEQEFRYPGPKPQSKEAAIIMIADSVEAAARTVPDPTPPKLRNMIDTIIVRIRDDGQFDECDITLRELAQVADSFVKVLMGIHHHRIAYPGYDFSRPGPVSVMPAASKPEDADRVVMMPSPRHGKRGLKEAGLKEAGGD
ncbi:MAG TPA: HDIG domain-containing protein [Blastocatellia bacterium]|nr:HDIG domain-containing protein [Blastocatellia bacterium]